MSFLSFCCSLFLHEKVCLTKAITRQTGSNTYLQTTQMGWLEGVLSLDGTLDKKQRKKRTLFLLLMLSSTVFPGMAALTYMGMDLSERFVSVLSLLVQCFMSLCLVIYILCKGPLTERLVVFACGVFSVGMLALDLSARSTSGSSWPMLVLVVDLLLVMQVQERFASLLVLCTLCYLVIIAAEEALRFGLLDLPGLVPQEGERGRRYILESKTSCTSPPCKVKLGESVRSFLLAASVFVIDFIATRGFARDVLKEQATMERTINAVQEIALLLAGYDVEQVAELLATHEHELPEGMTTALRRLEQNLRVYKAYLPKTCLPFEEDEDSCQQSDAISLSRESSDTANSSSFVKPNDTVLRVLGLASAEATLLTVNIKDTLRIVVEDHACFSELFAAVLSHALDATAARHGMVDVFVGDRIHCSFNVSRRCANHATSALHAATMLFRTSSNDLSAHFNIGIATGKVLRGDMGCEVMRRFSMVGALVRDVHLMERAGRVFGCDVLCNRICFTETECEHDLRLVPCRVEVSADGEGDIVAELLVPEEPCATVASDEWMYMIGGDKPWESYNIAVRRYLRNEVTASAVTDAAHVSSMKVPVRVVPSEAPDILRHTLTRETIPVSMQATFSPR